MKTVFHNPEANSVTWLDQRYYTLDNKNWYPSVTTVLDVAPKGYGFEEWLRNMGQDSKRILREAAIQGTHVHDAIDKLHKGEELSWIDTQPGEGVPNYTLDEWLMIGRYVEFYNKFKPKIVAFEFPLVNPKLGVGGRVDMIVDISGERYLIDIKTSNYLHDTNEMQVATYATMFNDVNKPEDQVKKTGILWLKAKTRGPAKGKIQGEGWQLKIYERDYAESFENFKMYQRIWQHMNPESKPKNRILPDKYTLNLKKKTPK